MKLKDDKRCLIIKGKEGKDYRKVSALLSCFSYLSKSIRYSHRPRSFHPVVYGLHRDRVHGMRLSSTISSNVSRLETCQTLNLSLVGIVFFLTRAIPLPYHKARQRLDTLCKLCGLSSNRKVRGQVSLVRIFAPHMSSLTPK